MADFIAPPFLRNKSTDEIHRDMLAELPEDIDASEGSHVWNLTRPTAIENARMCEFILPEVIKVMLPDWSYGEYLDGHARARGLSRHSATYAMGEITISGAANTEIPAGSVFSTASVNGLSAVDYATVETAEIPAGGAVTVAVHCTRAGPVGNTAANTVIMLASRITGVTAVTNAAAMSGGTQAETDESLRARISEYDRSQGSSFIGNAADYKRWANSVSGVGGATIIPADDDTGLVTIILTDSNGAPATVELCTSVYNYIMRPDEPGARLAPVNALLSVTPPSVLAIGVKATVELSGEATTESVKAAFSGKLASYMPTALEEGEVKYTRIAAALAAVEGASDFSSLQIGVKSGSTVSWGTANIAVTTSQLPEVADEDLILTAATV